MSNRIESFEKFWPYYLGQHRRPVCRGLHYVGTTVALVWLVGAAITLQPLLILPTFLSGYFFAWVGHFFVEKNRPATFTYPLWSLRADFRMYGKFVTGRLGRDADFREQCGRRVA